MRVLTVWHKLLIYFLKRKNDIIRNLTGITYVDDDDIEEIKTWSKAYIKEVLDRLNSTNDAGSCPWCIVNVGDCIDCSYGKRHRKCLDLHSPYKKILLSMRNNGYVLQHNGLYSHPDIKNLIEEIISVYKILPDIL